MDSKACYSHVIESCEHCTYRDCKYWDNLVCELMPTQDEKHHSDTFFFADNIIRRPSVLTSYLEGYDCTAKLSLSLASVKDLLFKDHTYITRAYGGLNDYLLNLDVYMQWKANTTCLI